MASAPGGAGRGEPIRATEAEQGLAQTEAGMGPGAGRPGRGYARCVSPPAAPLVDAAFSAARGAFYPFTLCGPFFNGSARNSQSHSGGRPAPPGTLSSSLCGSASE